MVPKRPEYFDVRSSGGRIGHACLVVCEASHRNVGPGHYSLLESMMTTATAPSGLNTGYQWHDREQVASRRTSARQPREQEPLSRALFRDAIVIASNASGRSRRGKSAIATL